jgi:hypothetical protein
MEIIFRYENKDKSSGEIFKEISILGGKDKLCHFP